jgi:ABC-type transport system involved in multi-copper enzyme maturation permease subunit
MTALAAPPLDAALGELSDFPERLEPLVVKELRQGLRARVFVWPVVVLPPLLALVAAWALLVDDVANGRDTLDAFLWPAVVGPVLIIAPARGLSAIRQERESGNLDLLLLSCRSARRIVIAKWISLLVQALLWVVVLSPFFFLRYFFGGAELVTGALEVGWTLIVGATGTAIAIFLSTMSRRAAWVAAFVVALVTLLFVTPLIAIVTAGMHDTFLVQLVLLPFPVGITLFALALAVSETGARVQSPPMTYEQLIARPSPSTAPPP